MPPAGRAGDYARAVSIPEFDPTSAVITLTVTAGTSAGQEYVFAERTTCIAGRADDCEPRIVEDGRTKLVSRHHCLFDINPPDLRVRDFGSLNGTHVNGEEIGRRQPGQTPEEGARQGFRERDLSDGDEVRLGDTVMRVGVIAATAGAPHMSPSAPPAEGPARCTECGRDVSAEAGLRRGELVCASCRRDPEALVRVILDKAQRGDDDLVAIRGYEIVRELGRGAQGVVYLARQEGTGEALALKVLLAAVAVEQSARDRFLREIETTRALEHPNIVAFRDSGCSGATFFFASEYCDGGSVDQLMVRQGGTLAPEEAVAIVSQILDGLAHAHAAELPGVQRADGSVLVPRGLVHRDIKPANILLSGTGPRRVAKLADFGLSKAFDGAGLSGHTRTGALGGTVVFMAREQIINFKYAKPEVDVWSVAATLYHMLTGRMTRNFRPGADHITVILHESAVPIRERDPSIAPRLAAVIDQALVDPPQIGIRSAHELKRALQDAV